MKFGIAFFELFGGAVGGPPHYRKRVFFAPNPAAPLPGIASEWRVTREVGCGSQLRHDGFSARKVRRGLLGYDCGLGPLIVDAS
jgi:hypothetical protein